MFPRKADDTLNNSELDSGDNVKGRLKKNVMFWEQLETNNYIFDIINDGYRFPFLQSPRGYISQNNKSALENEEFVSKAIDELLQSGSVIQVSFKPTIVNPLSVAFSSAGKPRLILDLCFVNNHLIKEHITFDDWRVFEQFVPPSCYLFKFDFRKGYHHVDIFPDHQLFLGFSWDIGGIDFYCVFTVLPFGLSTAPAVFTKVLRPLVSHWHQNGIEIAVYLDDGFGLGHSLEEAMYNLIK